MMTTLFTTAAAMKKNDGSLTDAQLKAELNRCEYCEEKPCKDGLPGGLLPGGLHHGSAGSAEKSDYRRAGRADHGVKSPRLGLRRGLPGLLLHEGLLAPHL